MFCLQINEELSLGLFEKRHAKELAELIDSSRSYLREWLPWIDYSNTTEDSEQFIKRSLEQFARNDGFQLAIRYKGKITGIIGLHAINWSNRSTSIGYWLGKEFQGNGLMTKACAAVISYCFEELDLHRIEIRAAAGNEKSQAIPEKLGFHNEGCIRESEWLYNHFVDHYVYGLLKKDYQK
jgi:ribosomal-protein-serine acetyltransferase